MPWYHNCGSNTGTPSFATRLRMAASSTMQDYGANREIEQRLGNKIRLIGFS
jgi:hypothetical protein